MTASHVIYLGLVCSILLAIESSLAIVVATAKSPVLSPQKNAEFLRTFETSLLKIFRMKQRPRPSGDVHIPQYMLDLYQKRTQRKQRQQNSIKMTNNPLYAANTIRSFYHKASNSTVDDDTSSVNSERMLFNVSSMHDTEHLKAAELRLYRAAAEQGENESDSTHHKHRIDVYDVLRPANGRQTEHIRRLLDTRMVDVSRSSWESFDVWPAVQRWREKPHTNHGLLVDFVTTTGHATTVRHVRLRRSVETENDWRQSMPLMVTYSDHLKTPSARTKRRTQNKGRRRGNKRRRKNQCRRHRLYVDFHTVRWDDWIIAPPGYNAYYCHGECPYILNDRLNSTNHAIVQTLVNSVSARAVPKPCCVPTKLSSISMLYMDEYDKVVLEGYQDMVVEACGCR